MDTTNKLLSITKSCNRSCWSSTYENRRRKISSSKNWRVEKCHDYENNLLKATVIPSKGSNELQNINWTLRYCFTYANWSPSLFSLAVKHFESCKENSLVFMCQTCSSPKCLNYKFSTYFTSLNSTLNT